MLSSALAPVAALLLGVAFLVMGNGLQGTLLPVRAKIENFSIGPDPGQVDPVRGRKGKLLSPARRRACIDRVLGKLAVSERQICRVLGQHRSTQRRRPRGRADPGYRNSRFCVFRWNCHSADVSARSTT